MNSTLVAIIFLGSVGIFFAVLLYYVSVKFKVFEDPRIADIENSLPGANCGGCGYAGCHNFASACVEENNFESMFCPVGGTETMSIVARILGKDVPVSEPSVAVLRCNGTCENRPNLILYDGARNCMVASMTTGKGSGCSWGCVGFGDCVSACSFGALSMNNETGLPEVDEEKCTSCGLCVKACPKGLFEIRKKGPGSRRIYVSCMNKDKGAAARKACAVACIGCGKCEKTCKYDAITLKSNLAYIDADKCSLCGECVEACPTGSIIETIPISERNVKVKVII